MEDENADASSLQSMVGGLVSPSLELLILWGSKYPTRLSWHRFSEAKIAFMGREQGERSYGGALRSSNGSTGCI
jgi:hypothetical protein